MICGSAGVITMDAVAVVETKDGPAHVTVRVDEPTSTGTAPPPYDSAGVMPLLQLPLPGWASPSYVALSPFAIAVGVRSVPVAVKVIFAGTKLTPFGASPPAVGVANTVFVPADGPSVQHTPALPNASVVVAAEGPYAPHVPPGGELGATTPPPVLTAQPTGTFWRTVPLRVLMVTTGRHSGETSVPAVASTGGQAALSAFKCATGETLGIGIEADGACDADTAVPRVTLNSEARPPTPPE